MRIALAIALTTLFVSASAEAWTPSVRNPAPPANWTGTVQIDGDTSGAGECAHGGVMAKSDRIADPDNLLTEAHESNCESTRIRMAGTASASAWAEIPEP